MERKPFKKILEIAIPGMYNTR